MEKRKLTVRKAISRALSDKGETQGWLAKKLSVSQTSVSQYISGRNAIGLSKIRKAMKLLGIDENGVSLECVYCGK